MNVTQEPKKVTLSSDFVKQAHSAACEDWKKKIEQELPELFPKVELTEKAKRFFSWNSGSYEHYWIDNLNQLLYARLVAENVSKIDTDRRLASIKIMNLIAEEWG